MSSQDTTSSEAFRGGSVLRKEDRRLIIGHGRYVGDIDLPGLLHAVFVRSTFAHGVVNAIDTVPAEGMPGVVGVWTNGTLGIDDLPVYGPVPVDAMPRPLLAGDRVRHAGESIAVVIATSESEALDAASMIWPDVDPLPPVLGFEDATGGDTLLFPERDDNVAERFALGDADADWDHAVDVTVEVANQRLGPVSIEALAVLADPTGPRLRVHVGHQAAHRLKEQIAQYLGIDADVIVDDVGGGFGLKGRLYTEYLVITELARRIGQPVRWLQRRREHFLEGTHGRDMTHVVRLAGDSDGRIRRAHIEIKALLGAYPHSSAQVPSFARLTAQGMYDIPHLSIESTSVVTTMAPTAPYRGAGRPEAAYAIERAVDVFAQAAGVDPVEVRRRNFVRQFPYRSNTGALYDSGDYLAVLDIAENLVDVPARRAEQQERIALGGNLIGVGFGAFVERAGGPADSAEYARVDVEADGSLTVYTGSTSNGQSHETVWAQLAAQRFDLPVDRVEVVGGDTSRVAQGWGSMASRSAQIGGSAVWRTSGVVFDRAREVAAGILEAAPDDVVMRDGHFAVVGAPGSEISLADVRAGADEAGVTLMAEEMYSPGAQTFPNGIHAAVVEVQPETGEVSVIDYVAVDDCGNVLNPMVVEGQTHGSIAQGFGQAMFEQIVYSDDGQVLTSTMMDYAIPHATDMPPMRLGRVETPAPSNPLGAKGSGEAGCIGAPPAIVNAVLDALRPVGVTAIDMPLTPHNVWRAIRNARS